MVAPQGRLVYLQTGKTGEYSGGCLGVGRARPKVFSQAPAFTSKQEALLRAAFFIPVFLQAVITPGV